MKKFSTLFLLLFAAVAFSGNAFGQVFFSEDFEGTMNATTDLPTGWSETGLSTDGIWSTDNNTNASSAYITWPAPNSGAIFAFTNDDDCNCDKSNDRMFVPAQNFSGMGAINMSFDLYLNGGYGETGYVLASNNGGTSFDTVATLPGGGNVWQNGQNVNLSAYAGDTSVIICFAYNDAATWAYGMGVDDVVLEELASSEDLEMISANGEYTLIPMDQVSAMATGGMVTNKGITNATDLVVTTEVWSSSNGFASPLTTLTSPNTTVNVGDTLMVNPGNYTPMTMDTFIFRSVVSSATLTDGIPANDTAQYEFVVTPFEYAREDSILTVGLGVNGTGSVSILGNNYAFDTTAGIQTVTVGVGGVATGDTTYIYAFNTDVSGMPTTPIDSVLYLFPNDGPGFFTIPTNWTLPSGEYFFGLQEAASVDNYGLQGSETIWTPNKMWGKIGTGAWTPIEGFGFNVSFFIRLNMNNGCQPTAATIDTSICQGQVYQVGANMYNTSGTYQDTILNSNGCDSVITSNVTVNPLPTVSFTGLDTFYCTNDNAAMLTGSPTGGTFSGNGISGNSFDPSAVSVGFHNITYTYADGNGCEASESQITQVDICSGMADGIFSELTVAPNPSDGLFNISGLRAGDEVKIYTIHGQMIFNKVMNSTDVRVELNDQPAGSYFMWLSRDGETTQIKLQIR